MGHFHLVWKALKQLFLAVRHSGRSHFSHSKVVYPDLHSLQRLCFSVFFGQWSSPSAWADIAGRIRLRLRMGLGLASTSADGLARLRWGITRAEAYNPAATSDLKALKIIGSSVLEVSALTSDLKRSQLLQTAVSISHQKILIYHFRVRRWVRHISASMSAKSTPPIWRLYS